MRSFFSVVAADALMFRTRNRYEQPTLKAQIYNKGMVVVRELMTGYQD
jgi:hypothetical protein